MSTSFIVKLPRIAQMSTYVSPTEYKQWQRSTFVSTTDQTLWQQLAFVNYDGDWDDLVSSRWISGFETKKTMVNGVLVEDKWGFYPMSFNPFELYDPYNVWSKEKEDYLRTRGDWSEAKEYKKVLAEVEIKDDRIQK